MIHKGKSSIFCLTSLFFPDPSRIFHFWFTSTGFSGSVTSRMFTWGVQKVAVYRYHLSFILSIASLKAGVSFKSWYPTKSKLCAQYFIFSPTKICAPFKIILKITKKRIRVSRRQEILQDRRILLNYIKAVVQHRYGDKAAIVHDYILSGRWPWARE